MDIQKEYNFKQGQTENAETTLQMLKVEFQKRDSDLVKLEQAEERINTELKSLNAKTEMMQDQIRNKFSHSERDQKELLDKRNRLLKDQTELNKQRAALQAEVILLYFKLKNSEYDYELKETKFNRHENYKKFTDQEKKFSMNE